MSSANSRANVELPRLCLRGTYLPARLAVSALLSTVAVQAWQAHTEAATTTCIASRKQNQADGGGMTRKAGCVQRRLVIILQLQPWTVDTSCAPGAGGSIDHTTYGTRNNIRLFWLLKASGSRCSSRKGPGGSAVTLLVGT
jgi:hypothetical protein